MRWMVGGCLVGGEGVREKGKRKPFDLRDKEKVEERGRFLGVREIGEEEVVIEEKGEKEWEEDYLVNWE